MIDLFTATGHIHYSKSARLNLQTIALIYQIKFAEEAYHSTAIAIGPVYGLVLSQSRLLCDALIHTMHPCAEIHNAI